MADKRLDYVAGYQHEIDYALADGEGLILRQIRQSISRQTLSPDWTKEVERLDLIVLLSVFELGDDIAGYLVVDDDAHPLQEWWWHLGKIRDKTYPADLLPPYLQAVYAETPGRRLG